MRERLRITDNPILKNQVRYIQFDTEIKVLRDKYYQTHSAQEKKR